MPDKVTVTSNMFPVIDISHTPERYQNDTLAKAREEQQADSNNVE